MSFDGLSLVILAVLLLFSYTTEAVTGFGSIVLALTIGANFFPIKTLLPLLVPLNLFLSGSIIARHHAHIVRPLLVRRIFPFMGTGVLAGVALFQVVEGPLLKRVFGGLVILFALRELLRGRGGQPPLLSDVRQIFWLLASGITHGVYASGGPLLVCAVGRLPLSKSEFRVTLSTVWFVLNLLLTIIYLVTGQIQASTWRLLLLMLPIVPLGLFIGERLHRTVSEEHFRVVIHLLLVVAGVSLLR